MLNLFLMPFSCSRIPHDTVILSPQATTVSQILLVFENHNSEVYLCVFCRMCLVEIWLVFFSWLDWDYESGGETSQREMTFSSYLIKSGKYQYDSPLLILILDTCWGGSRQVSLPAPTFPYRTVWKRVPRPSPTLGDGEL